MFQEIGVTGLNRWGGTITEEFLTELHDQHRRVRVYKEMSSNDATIGAILFAFEMILREATWRVEPATQNTRDLDAAEFVESCMHDMSHSWGDFISEALSMLTYGWSLHEVVYKRRNGRKRDAGSSSRHTDGLIGWRKLPVRSQDTLDEWVFDPTGGIQGMRQRHPNTGIVTFIPIQKSVLFRVRNRKNNPEGESLLRNAYRAWYFKKNLETIEGIGVERDLAGLPKAYAPAEWFSDTATANQKTLLTELERVVKNIRRDEQAGLTIPSVFDEHGNRLLDIELMASSGARSQDVDKIITRKSQEIATTILADVILLGHENVGSLALATSKAELLNTSLNSILQSIAYTMNRHELPRLFRVNGLPQDALPTLRPQPIENVNLEALGTFVTNLAGAGAEVFPDDKLENHLRHVAGLPQKELAEDL